MQKSEKINELASALVKVQGKLQPAKKETKNAFIGNKYADLTSVWESCRELLAANDLAVVQTNSIAENGVIVETMLIHSSGQWIMGQIFVPIAAEKGKSNAQVVGSAVSYGRRYGLQSIVGICAEDDDGNAAGGSSSSETRTKSSEKEQNGNAEQKPSGDMLTMDEAKACMDQKTKLQDLVDWINANRKRVPKEAMTHFQQRMQTLKQQKAA